MNFATPNFDQAVPELRMIVTPWMVDAAGNHYRLVFAAGTKIEDVGYCASSSEKLISTQICPVAGHSTQQ